MLDYVNPNANDKTSKAKNTTKTKSANPPTPKNWPYELPYLKAPQYSPSLTPDHFAFLHSKPSTALTASKTPTTSPPQTASTSLIDIAPSTPRGPSTAVKIQHITDPAHPANRQAGLFAARDLKPGECICEYLGVIHAEPSANTAADSLSTADIPSLHRPDLPSHRKVIADTHAHSDYDLSLCRSPVALAIDAFAAGNEARFTNDYRGIAARPNAEFREIWSVARGERGMGVFVLPEGKKKKFRGVKKGEEVLVSYGRGFWGARREELAENEEGEES